MGVDAEDFVKTGLLWIFLGDERIHDVATTPKVFEVEHDFPEGAAKFGVSKPKILHDRHRRRLNW